MAAPVLGGRLQWTHSADWGVAIPMAQLEWQKEHKSDPELFSAFLIDDPTQTPILSRRSGERFWRSASWGSRRLPPRCGRPTASWEELRSAQEEKRLEREALGEQGARTEGPNQGTLHRAAWRPGRRSQ